MENGLVTLIREQLGFKAPEAELKLLEGFFQDVVVLDLNSDIVEQTISIRRAAKIKTPDAIVYQLSLITRNHKDFKNIPRLNIIDPYTA